MRKPFKHQHLNNIKRLWIRKKRKIVSPWPGFEPGSSEWQTNVVTNRPRYQLVT